ncbi:MAG: hypothetical protein R3331_02890 [Sulfurospirillaceae bacterium]|nr:hypothetical protein [Sulfurospirillaceae bacterium]
MVKKIFLLAFIATFAFANLQDKIISYMGAENYAKQENLVKILFKNESNFYRQSDGSVDSLKVIKELQDNGLLKLFYNSPIFLHIKFITDKNPLIFTRVISESLEAIGYNYFLTEEAAKSENKFTWTINLKTKRIINPILFAQELEKRGCKIEDIIKENDDHWEYKIDSQDAKLNTVKLENDINTDLPKPIQPYWIENNNAKSIKIKTSFSDHWYPLVLFLDRGLHLISQTKINERTYGITLKVPKDCKYIRIGDIYTLDNIKHGLSVYLKSNN